MLALIGLTSCYSAFPLQDSNVSLTQEALDSSDLNNESVLDTVETVNEASQEQLQSKVLPTFEDAIYYINLERPTATFSLSDSNHTTPDDVLHEVSYSGGAGGMGGCPIDSSIQDLHFLSDRRNSAEWMDFVVTEMCGWTPNENLQFNVISENDITVYSEEIGMESGGYLVHWYRPAINTFPGTYTLEFRNKSGQEAHYAVEITPPERSTFISTG